MVMDNFDPFFIDLKQFYPTHGTNLASYSLSFLIFQFFQIFHNEQLLHL